MNTLRNPKYTGIIWLLVRLWLGYEWISAASEKLFGEDSAAWVGPRAGSAIAGFLKSAIAKSALAPGFDAVKTAHPAVQTWYAELVQNYILPNVTTFSYLVAFGELLVGVALIVGIFTHFAALMGIMMNLAYLLAGANGINPNMLVLEMVILLAGGVAVGYYGLDFFARPMERDLFQHTRTRFFPQPQTA